MCVTTLARVSKTILLISSVRLFRGAKGPRKSVEEIAPQVLWGVSYVASKNASGEAFF